MLVLKRRKWEEIIITCRDGERIKVRVNDLGAGTVKLGFEAHDDIEINRKEIQDEIDGGKPGGYGR
jgi:carbon storage regulator CsrA